MREGPEHRNSDNQVPLVLPAAAAKPIARALIPMMRADFAGGAAAGVSVEVTAGSEE